MPVRARGFRVGALVGIGPVGSEALYRYMLGEHQHEPGEVQGESTVYVVWHYSRFAAGEYGVRRGVPLHTVYRLYLLVTRRLCQHECGCGCIQTSES